MGDGGDARSDVRPEEPIAADWSEEPFLTFIDGSGKQRFVRLSSAASLSMGRDPACDIALPWDASISRLHAQLDRIGPDWTLLDEGMSRNGTFLNGDRINGRRRLQDGDTFVVGETSIQF